MEDGEVADVVVVGQVRVEACQRVGGGETLVDDRAERARGHVGVVRGALDALAQAQRGALVGLPVVCWLEGDVHDVRHRAAGEIAELVDVCRNDAPVDDLQRLLRRRCLDGTTWVISADEEDRHAGVGVVAMARDGCEQPCSVGGLGVGRDRATVLHAGEPLQRGGDDRAAGAALGVGDEPDSTSVPFTGREDGRSIPLERGRSTRSMWHGAVLRIGDCEVVPGLRR